MTLSALLTSAAVASFAIALPARTQAQTDDPDPREPAPSLDAAMSADTGAFLPWTMAARSDAQDALVSAQGGYDSARDAALLESAVEASILDRIALRAGISYLDGLGARPSIGLRLDLLRQEEHGPRRTRSARSP